MYFHNVSRSLADKLESLWKLAEAHQPTENEIKQFADQIAGIWASINRQVIFILLLKKFFFILKTMFFPFLYLFNFNLTLLLRNKIFCWRNIGILK